MIREDDLFTAHYTDRDEYKRCSDTVNSHVRIHRKENHVLHKLESGEEIETRVIER